MFAELHYPSSLSPHELDTYLANGWFRMGQTIFTTNFLRFGRNYYSAIWLRIDLQHHTPSKTQQKLFKVNSSFFVEIQHAKITDKHEVLFEKYKSSMSFDTASSLRFLLHHDGVNDVYDTFFINIYDGIKLIATGVFDMGKDTSAGISCFYDPDYKKNSLGKYLMYLKMEYSKKRGVKYFYTGYFAPGYPLFDYKLDLSRPNLEYLDVVTEKWMPFAEFSYNTIPLDIMCEKLKTLQEVLEKQQHKITFFHYPYFDTEMNNELNGAGLLDYPAFLYCFEVDESLNKLLIVYDIRDAQYHLLGCHALYKLVYEINDEDNYRSHLIEPLRVMYSCSTIAEMAVELDSLMVKR